MGRRDDQMMERIGALAWQNYVKSHQKHQEKQNQELAREDKNRAGTESSKKLGNTPSGDDQGLVYFECNRPSGDGTCSDDQCPCGYPGTNIPRGTGYLYIGDELVEMRRDTLTVKELEKKVIDLQQRMGASMMTTASGVFMPILMCELGAKKRKIDLSVAAADAKHWWQAGMAPLRATPMASAVPVAASQRGPSHALADDRGESVGACSPGVPVDAAFRIPIEDVFTIAAKGTVVTGCVAQGVVRIGDPLILWSTNGACRDTVCDGIEAFEQVKTTAQKGDHVGLVLRGIKAKDVAAGDVVSSPPGENAVGVELQDTSPEGADEVLDIKFNCPHCEQHLEAPGEMAGTELSCPACEKDIRVPEAAPSCRSLSDGVPGVPPRTTPPPLPDPPGSANQTTQAIHSPNRAEISKDLRALLSAHTALTTAEKRGEQGGRPKGCLVSAVAFGLSILAFGSVLSLIHFARTGDSEPGALEGGLNLLCSSVVAVVMGRRAVRRSRSKAAEREPELRQQLDREVERFARKHSATVRKFFGGDQERLRDSSAIRRALANCQPSEPKSPPTVPRQPPRPAQQPAKPKASRLDRPPQTGATTEGDREAPEPIRTEREPVNSTVKKLCKLNSIPKGKWRSIDERLLALSQGDNLSFVKYAHSVFPKMGKLDAPTLYLNIRLGI